MEWDNVVELGKLLLRKLRYGAAESALSDGVAIHIEARLNLVQEALACLLRQTASGDEASSVDLNALSNSYDLVVREQHTLNNACE